MSFHGGATTDSLPSVPAPSGASPLPQLHHSNAQASLLISVSLGSRPALHPGFSFKGQCFAVLVLNVNF